MAVAFAMVMALAPSALADGHSGVYISLGDSLASGFQASDSGPQFVTDHGYTDVLFQRVKGDLGLAEHVKLGCPGETSTSMIAGGCPAEGLGGSPTYATGSQLGDAVVAALAAGPDLELITIDIGANDVLVCAAALDPAACLGGVLPTLVCSFLHLAYQYANGCVDQSRWGLLGGLPKRPIACLPVRHSSIMNSSPDAVVWLLYVPCVSSCEVAVRLMTS